MSNALPVQNINVNTNGAPVVIWVKFNRTLPALIDVTATTANGQQLGRLIINDLDNSNDAIAFDNISTLVDSVIWLRVIVHHPSLKNFDFLIEVIQDNQLLHQWHSTGKLKISTFFYQGMSLKGAL